MTAGCRSRRRCAGVGAVDGRGAPTRLDGGPLCDGCLNRARFDIAALRCDYLALTAELAPPGRSPEAFVSGGDTDAPVPLALGVDALQRRIVWTLTVWEPPVREVLGVAPAPSRGVRASWVVATSTRLLARHVRRLAAIGPTWGYADGLDAGPVERDGVYGVESLSALHDVAARVLGVVPVTRPVSGMCSHCGGFGSLQHDDGSDVVRCAACGSAESYDEHRRGYGMNL